MVFKDRVWKTQFKSLKVLGIQKGFVPPAPTIFCAVYYYCTIVIYFDAKHSVWLTGGPVMFIVTHYYYLLLLN